MLVSVYYFQKWNFIYKRTVKRGEMDKGWIEIQYLNSTFYTLSAQMTNFQLFYL